MGSIMRTREEVSLDRAADRFFRSYHAHCTRPDEDTLFHLLNVMHSLNDKLRKASSTTLFASQSFIGLKALRNLFHHEGELIHEVRIIPVGKLPPVSMDLMSVCLVARDLVERAAGSKDPASVTSAFRWYGGIADIEPAIFNMAVDAFEVLHVAGARPSSDAYRAFAAQYEAEEDEGRPHHVTGEIRCRAGDVEEVLRVAFAQTPASRSD
ncbi:hypothetical protein ACQVP2_31830 [Methylobacterium aquaticum]|uniref:hypothetical protein n=1 Tax=Methylobacterium aquaticum TaxID=270351 RepID=UPI003D17D463